MKGQKMQTKSFFLFVSVLKMDDNDQRRNEMEKGNLQRTISMLKAH